VGEGQALTPVDGGDEGDVVQVEPEGEGLLELGQREVVVQGESEGVNGHVDHDRAEGEERLAGEEGVVEAGAEPLLPTAAEGLDGEAGAARGAEPEEEVEVGEQEARRGVAGGALTQEAQGRRGGLFGGMPSSEAAVEAEATTVENRVGPVNETVGTVEPSVGETVWVTTGIAGET
jgi:hypothetical protein